MSVRTRNHAWEVATTIFLVALAIYLLLRMRAQANGTPFPGLPGIDYPAVQYVVPGVNLPAAAPGANLSVNLSPWTVPTNDATGGVIGGCNCPSSGQLSFGSNADQAAALWAAGAFNPGGANQPPS